MRLRRSPTPETLRKTTQRLIKDPVCGNSIRESIQFDIAATWIGIQAHALTFAHGSPFDVVQRRLKSEETTLSDEELLALNHQINITATEMDKLNSLIITMEIFQ